MKCNHETRNLSSGPNFLPAKSLGQEAWPALRALTTIPMISFLSVPTGGSDGPDRVSTLGSPGDDTPSQEPPRLLMQEGGGSSEVKQPDLMGLVGSIRVIFCSSGICSHLKCRLQSNPTGKAGRGWVQGRAC